MKSFEELRERWRWVFALAVVVLLVAAGAGLGQMWRQARMADRVERTYRVLEQIDGVMSALKDAETGQRGFLLTGDDEFLAPYEAAAPTVVHSIEELRKLTADDAAQRTSVERMLELSRSKLEELAQTIAAYRRNESEVVERRVSEGHGLRLMDELRGVASEMRVTQEGLLEQRVAARSQARRISYLIVGLTAIMAVCLAAAARVVERQFEQRRKVLEKESEARRAAEAGRAEAAAKIRESEEHFRVMADAVPQIVWSAPADGQSDYINDKWYQYTGMARPERDGAASAQVGPPVNRRQYMHPEDIASMVEKWEKSVATGEPFLTEYRLRRHDGVYRWFMGRALPLRDAAGKVTRWFGTSTDIDDQKKGEQERERLLAGERAARSEAERAARVKDEFVATLSHELRTPLNAILGWTHILKKSKDAATIEKAIEVIDRNGRVQAQMVEDLLDMNRILSGKMRLEVQDTDLASVVEAAMQSVQPAADAKGVKVTAVLGSAAPVRGDPSRLQQVVWNLLTNAIKFTSRGGKVQVTLRKAGSGVEIEVSDTGQGIKPDFLPRLFERFRQADASTTRQHGGLGLGLSIVKHLVEMHGGIVWAMSPGEGQGAMFTVRLPMAAARPAQSGPEALRAAAKDEPAVDEGEMLRGLRVLVVDDEPDARELVQRVLRDCGAEVVTAASVREALSTFEKEPAPHIVVSDIGMPGEDGYELIKRVRAMSGVAGRVPAAALTALARLEDRKRALLAGYQSHIAKPVDPSELVAVVATLAGRTGGP